MKAVRGPAISFRADPFRDPGALVHHGDALILIEDGRIAGFGPYDDLAHRLGEVVPVRYRDVLICAGFVDAHVHYPQVDMIGATAAGLLDWLERYTFPAEQRFAEPAHAERAARLFLAELLGAGVTTACVYCTVHPHSVDAFFAESARLGTRMIAGKVLMDRNAPAALLDTARRGYDESAALISRWHGRGRQHYCVTPRFAPTSTPAQLEAAAALLREHDGLFLQTHLAETEAECAWVRALCPGHASYLDVYARAGLSGARSVFGHAIHVSEADLWSCHHAGAALAHCPTSNLFLGSGLFRLSDALDPRRPVRVGLGSDVGAGTSLSPLRTAGAAHQVAALRGGRLDAAQAFYLATWGGARALCLGDRVGRLAAGYDADFCVLDLKATPLLAYRTGFCESVEDVLSVLMTVGDERAVRATWVAGELAYDADRCSLGCSQ